MIIKSISIKPITYKMMHDLKSYSINHKTRDSWIIKMTDTDNFIGYGEASPLTGFNTETFDESGYALQGFKIALDDLQDDIKLKEMMILIEAHTFNCSSAFFAIQTAIYDILSQKNNLPLNRYLNSQASSGIKVNGIYGLTQTQNYKTLKIKCGFRNLYDEIDLLTTLTEDHQGMSFILDLNQAYDLPKAIRFCKEMRRFNIAYIEQPIDKNNLEDLAELRLHSDIPIALDESIHGIDSITNIINYNAADIFILKPQSLGSFNILNQAIKLIKSESKKATITSSLEGVIGRACTMHLVSANKIDSPCGLCMEPIYTNEKKPFPKIKNGAMTIPDYNGIGYVE